MARASVNAMRGHLDELAAELDAWLDEGWPGVPATTARLEVARGSDGTITNAVVRYPELRDRRAYFSALHEFGHLHAARSGQLVRNPLDDDARVLFDEAHAWAWAFENARFPATFHIAEDARRCILGYRLDLGFPDDGGFYGQAAVAAWGLGDEYERYIAVIEAADGRGGESNG